MNQQSKEISSETFPAWQLLVLQEKVRRQDSDTSA